MCRFRRVAMQMSEASLDSIQTRCTVLHQAECEFYVIGRFPFKVKMYRLAKSQRRCEFSLT